MSEEEMKVVDYWKNYMEILHWNTQLVSEHHMKVLLDLIEKQSKEIEELKENNKKYIDLHYVPYEQYTSKLNESNKKWKDIIKAKIEELKQKKYILSSRESEIEILQSLLEKEE